jgi:hypothetical protein
MISVTIPITRAFLWMKQVLFNPFDFEKWCLLGFCAFLAGLAEGGGGGRTGSHRTFGHQSNPWFSCDGISGWVSSHMPWVILLAVVAFAFLLVFVLLTLWLGSRGQFMFLDGVARNRAAVVESWHRFRGLGNDLFIFMVQLGICTMIVVALLGVLAWKVAQPDIAARHFGAASITALLAAGIPFVLVCLALLLVSLTLSDFVVPIMYRRDIGTGQAIGVLWREIIPGHGGEVVLFFLMKIALLFVALILMIIGTYSTCFIAILPYVGTVVFLPVYVFFRAYSLYFLEQFGEEWRMVGVQPPAEQV